MVESRTFQTEQAAQEFVAALPAYRNPAQVVPLKGEAAHEVAVGPVHAGVIEPGHSRFQCVGETVYNLQIFVGYQHRGVEAEIVAAENRLERRLALAETCAGDTSIAAATALSEILEAAFPQRYPPPSAAALRDRRVLLELERIANHVGDLGALSGDIAFLPTAAYCGRIRGDILNLTALICGNRFGRGAVVPGGVRRPIVASVRDEMLAKLRTIECELQRALDLFFENPTVLERLSGTGTVDVSLAAALGLCGVARRASDEGAGDVLARAQVRRREIDASMATVRRELGEPADASAADGDVRPSGPPDGYRVFTSTVDAWRGPLRHAAAFRPDGRMVAYRIADPSAVNWQGLACAMRGEQISNFPICNKSFNLSYCGTDR